MSHEGGANSFLIRTPGLVGPFWLLAYGSNLWVSTHTSSGMGAHMHMYLCVCLGEAFTSGVAPVFSFLTGKSADSGAGTILALWPCDLGLNPTPLSPGL